MPDPYPDVRYQPTESARNAADSLGISVSAAIHAVQNYDVRHPGRKAGQWWYAGRSPVGDTLRVLIQENLPANVIIITFHRQERPIS